MTAKAALVVALAIITICLITQLIMMIAPLIAIFFVIWGCIQISRHLVTTPQPTDLRESGSVDLATRD